MTIETELNKYKSNLKASYAAVGQKTTYRPSEENFDNLPETIAHIDAKVASGVSPLTFNSLGDNPLRDYKVYGNSLQNAYSGKQLIKGDGFATLGNDTSFWSADVSSYLTPQENGWAHFEFENTGSDNVNKNTFINLENVQLNTASRYTVVVELRNIVNAPINIRVAQSNILEAFTENVLVAKPFASISRYTLTTKDSFDGVRYGLRLYTNCTAGLTTSFDIRVSIYPGVVNLDDFSYEPYVGGTPSPSPDYPQEIESVGNSIADGATIPVTTESGGNTTTTEIHLDEPLRKIGDYADYIDYKRQKVVRKIGKARLDGTETGWATSAAAVDPGVNAFSLYNAAGLFGANNTVPPMSDYFSGLTPEHWNDDKSSGTMVFSNASITTGNNLYLRISNSVVGNSVDALQAWLGANNVVIYFVLETPVEEDIVLPAIPRSEGQYTVSVDTTTPPSDVWLMV